jgi:hypothetical protein
VNQAVNGWQIFVLAGWAIAVWMFFSVLFSATVKFSNLGKSKGKWFLLSLAAFVPYIGFIFVFAYLFKVRAHFPPKPRAPTRRYPSSPAGAPARSPYEPYKAPEWPKGPKTCPTCNGGKLGRYCGQCQNGWISSPGGGLESCHAGCQYGRFPCDNCHGRGTV